MQLLPRDGGWRRPQITAGGPAALAARGRIRMPWRRASRESVVTLSSRSAVAQVQMSRPGGRWGIAGSRWPGAW